MSILDDLIGLLAPHACLACGAEGRLLCPACQAALTAVEPRCYRCQRPSADGSTCLNCPAALSKVSVATSYQSHAKTLIWQLKLNGAQAAARIMAKYMVSMVDEVGNAWLVPVPTATSRARQRGYDQAKLLAREISRQTNLPYLECLARHGQTSQHGTSRHDRLNQLDNAFRIKRPHLIKNTHIILVDDVITTGATLEIAARTLRKAGAEQVEAITFARPD